MIGQACQDLASLNHRGLVLEHLAINVSNVQLRNPDELEAELRRAIAAHALAPQQVEIEVTESFLAHDADRALLSLQALRQMGVQLAIDDFGTGYSSLNRLQKLPFTRLKVDKSFVDGLPHDADSVTLVRAILNISHAFGMAVTAEGVEREDQVAFLRSEFCDDIQGFYYARPMPLADFEQWVELRQQPPAQRLHAVQ